MGKKTGSLSLVTTILAILIIGGFVWWILSTKIKASGGSIVEFLKDQNKVKTTEEENEEALVKEDLKKNAEKVLDEFASMSIKCSSSSSFNSCLCGIIDMTKLNDYSLKVTRIDNDQVVELLDENHVPTGKKASAGNSYLAADINNFNPTHTIFSKDMVTFNFEERQLEKFEDAMQAINFIKLGKGGGFKDRPYEYILISDQTNAERC